MARSPTDTIKFLTFDELGRLFAATRTSARDRALFLIAYRHALTPLIWEHVNPTAATNSTCAPASPPSPDPEWRLVSRLLGTGHGGG